MTGGFNVDPEQLSAHAQTVDGVAASVDEAASAAVQEWFGGLVYGVLFDPLVLIGMGAWANHLYSVIHECGQTGHEISGGLASNAEAYDGIEKTTTTTVHKSGQGPR